MTPRNAQASAVQCMDGSKGRHIVGSKDAVERNTFAQQPFGDRFCLQHPKRGVVDQALVIRQPRRRQRIAIAKEPLLCLFRLNHPCEMDDPTTSMGDQMRSRLSASRSVRWPNR